MVENDKVGVIIAKDMSRIGRNYLEVGLYTEMLFPEHDVRFIAVNSGVDSANQQDNDFTPFLNIINEFYFKDSSNADCGEKLYYCTSNSFETRQDHFVCSTSRKKGKEVCDTHFIRAVVLEEGTLQHMRLVIQCVADYENAFRKALGAKRSDEARKELSAKKRTLQKSENRLAELDRLFKRIYEDMVNAVYVHAPDKSNGHRVQDATISYNYIGILPANLLYDVMNGKAA